VAGDKEVWILGASGRIGRTVATTLAARGLRPVLVGRDRARLDELAGSVGGAARVVVAGSLDAMVAELSRARPAVVVNTIGPFAETAPAIVRACPPGTHYVDVANELDAITGLLGLHEEARASGRCLVTGAGFGLLATESVVLALCADRPPAARVRVDALPLIIGTEPLGPTVAATVVDAMAAGGRRYAEGKLVRAGVGGDSERLTAPDGTTVVTGAVPLGDLEAARRASRAPFAVAASSEAPAGPLARVLMTALSKVAAWRPLRGVLRRQLARLRLPAPPPSRAFSWGHARVQWADGSVREGWLRAPEGMAFTCTVMSEVAARLANGGSRPGAYTPGALFGPGLAEAAGGTLLLDGAAP